jgi:ribosomal protein S27AE
MLKENGREKPARKIELSNLKGRHMYCSNCSEYAILTNVKFASTKCGRCGSQMLDVDMTNANKTTG